LAHQIYAKLASERERTKARLVQLKSPESQLVHQQRQELCVMHHCVYPRDDSVPSKDKGEATCAAPQPMEGIFKEDMAFDCDLDRSHHSILDSPLICEYLPDTCESPKDNGEHTCVTKNDAVSHLFKSSDVTCENGEQEQDQSINEALKVIEQSLSNLHQSLAMIKDKKIDPIAKLAIEQNARALQVLVTTNSMASAISSITTPSDGYTNHHLIYDPWDTDDQLCTTFMLTPPHEIAELTVVSEESTDSTFKNKSSSSHDEPICWQASLPDFNGKYFMPTDPEPQDPVYTNGTQVLTPADHVPTDPTSKLFGLLGSNEEFARPVAKKPPDPSSQSEDILGSNPVYFSPKDPVPPDPSSRPHAIKSKRGIPEIEEHPKHKKKRNCLSDLVRGILF
jgi:hypothetical protein